MSNDTPDKELQEVQHPGGFNRRDVMLTGTALLDRHYPAIGCRDRGGRPLTGTPYAIVWPD